MSWFTALKGKTVDILIFFDINGTLVLRDERTDIPFSTAIDTLLGVTDAMKGVDTSARSDKDVFLEVLERNGKAFSNGRWDEFLRLYIKELEKFAATDVWRENVDAVWFVRALKARGYILALVTGELSVGAEYKLKKLGIWDCFLTGGYGEDGLKRFEIADSALAKVKKMHERDFKAMYVIGDTVLDIETAAHLGARSIAITTGSHSREKLLAAGPDYCIDKFREVESLLLR
jgi:phosphoglycolate phosphatase-like HAD superfamily hydrolase